MSASETQSGRSAAGEFADDRAGRCGAAIDRALLRCLPPLERPLAAPPARPAPPDGTASAAPRSACGGAYRRGPVPGTVRTSPGRIAAQRAAATLFALMSSIPPSSAGEPATVAQLLSTQTTPSGQPIVLPQHDVQLLVSRFVIAPGAALPTHMHPWQRYGYLIAGHLRVTLTETGQVFDYKPGDFIVEVSNAWHSGTAVGDEPVVLLVIDQVEAGHDNTVLQRAR